MPYRIPYRLYKKLQRNHQLLVQFSLLLIASVALNVLIQKVPALSQTDTRLFGFIHGIPHTDWLNTLVAPVNFNTFVNLPNTTPWFIYFLSLLLLIYVFIKKRNLFWWVVAILILSLLLARLASIVNWFILFRERPFLSLVTSVDQYSAQIWGKFASYPSGHARDTALIATLLAAYIPHIRLTALLFTVFVAWSRVYLGAHFPFDVIVGSLIGFGAARVAIGLVNEIRLQKEAAKVK